MNSVKLSYGKRFSVAAIVLSLFISLSFSTLLIREVAASTTHEVNVTDFAFVPQNLTISPGDSILWNNTDQVIHTLWFVYVANGSTYLLSDPIPPDTTWMHTFNEAVELQYYSFDMLWITGFISVTGAVPDIAVTSLTICYGQTVIPQNRTRSINVTVTNEGQTDETFTLTVYWNTTHTIGSTSVSLLIGETKIVQFSWYPDQTRYLNYTLSAVATPVPGEIDTADNTFVGDTVIIVWPGDVDADKEVTILDVVKITGIYASKYPEPLYNANSDLDCDGEITILDVVICTSNYAYKEP